MFSGPWQWSWDISVKKSIAFTERHTLDLHLEMFNFANHPTFYLYPATARDSSIAHAYEINNTTFGQITDMNCRRSTDAGSAGATAGAGVRPRGPL